MQQIPYDAALPQMANAMQVAAMREVFQKNIFSGSRFQIQSCEIQRLKHKSGQNCMIAYRLGIVDTNTQEADEQIICARVYPPGETLSRFDRAFAQPLSQPQFGQPLMHLPELDMIAWVFPNDRKLVGLPKIMSQEFLAQEFFPAALAKHFGHDWQLAALTHKLVHYVPEHTCTVRADLRLRHVQNGAEQEVVLFGKTYYNAEGEEAYRNMQRLWKSAARRRGELNMAQPFTFHPASNSLWQFGLSGKTLMECEMTSETFLSLLPAAAKTVALLHRSALNCARSIQLDSVRKKLIAMNHLLRNSRAVSQSLATGLIERLIDFSSHLSALPAAPLHGDLHLKNFFVTDGKVALIDMDNLCNGNPLQDAGSFIASLWYRGILTGVAPARILKITETFTQTYKRGVPWYVSQNELDWYTAVALINERAFRCLTRLKAGRLDILDRLLELANRMAA